MTVTTDHARRTAHLCRLSNRPHLGEEIDELANLVDTLTADNARLTSENLRLRTPKAVVNVAQELTGSLF